MPVIVNDFQNAVQAGEPVITLTPSLSLSENDNRLVKAAVLCAELIAVGAAACISPKYLFAPTLFLLAAGHGLLHAMSQNRKSLQNQKDEIYFDGNDMIVKQSRGKRITEHRLQAAWAKARLMETNLIASDAKHEQLAIYVKGHALPVAEFLSPDEFDEAIKALNDGVYHSNKPVFDNLDPGNE